jgi:hypothetical protein
MEEIAQTQSIVAETKAKMAQTSREYVPVPVESDPWTIKTTAPVATMEQAVDTVKSILGGTTEKDIQRCPHGDMVWKTGKSKAGDKMWGHFRCMNHILGEAERCEPIWYEIKSDGTWGKQK